MRIIINTMLFLAFASFFFNIASLEATRLTQPVGVSVELASR